MPGSLLQATFLMPTDSATLRTLYLHFPFCARICPFCAFAVRKDRPEIHEAYGSGLLQELQLRLATGLTPFDESGNSVRPELVEGRTPSMLRQAQHERGGRSQHITFDSVYLGGGTPSRMTLAELERFFSGLRETVTLSPTAEIAFELNPEDVEPGYLSGLRELGVTRLSLGGQSFQDTTLKRLGRVHDARQLRKALEIIQAAEFDNWNLDLMFGIPGQPPTQFQADLTEAFRWRPAHVSLYGLEVHDSTPFSRDPEIQNWEEGHHPEVAEMYLAGVERLESAGLRQYEVSNFARPGNEGRQNLRVWDGEPYLGLGTGAHSFANGSRWGNVRSLKRYLDAVTDGLLPEAFRETPDRAQQASEWLMLQLRRVAGVNLEAWREHFGNQQPLPHALLERLHHEGKAVWNPPHLRLTPSGFLLADGITAQLLP